MADASLSRGSTRITRGVELFLTRRHEIHRIKADVYSVPSCSSSERYTVWTDLRACTCPDHPRAKAEGTRCKHLFAALLAKMHRRELREIAKKERRR